MFFVFVHHLYLSKDTLRVTFFSLTVILTVFCCFVSVCHKVGNVASFIPPHGCHVEMDTSIECAELTLGYWLALSMSDVIVTQSDPTDGGGAQVTNKHDIA
jgi:hypothetical protein